jgi:hypothetical protein
MGNDYKDAEIGAVRPPTVVACTTFTAVPLPDRGLE